MLKPVIERFLEKISVSEDGCWNWTASKHEKGYGHFFINHKTIMSHRWLYEYFHGPIKKEMDVHHICENKSCCNPTHLKAITRLQHEKQHMKQYCKNGHKFTDVGYYLHNGRRNCKQCVFDRNKIQKERIRIAKFLIQPNTNTTDVIQLVL